MSEGQQQRVGETIEKKTRHARQQLLDLLTHLRNRDGTSDGSGHGLSQTSVTDVLEKFGLWAANLGALQGPTTRLSLDHRLSAAPELREEISKQLEDISEAADDCLGLEGDPAVPQDESHMILEVISEAIGSLFRIGILIRRATTRDRFNQALQASDLVFPPEFDIDYVREKHPKTRSGWLSGRLGGAIAKRRQLISYCRDHRSRLGAEQTLEDGTTSQKDNVSSKATTFAPKMDLKELEVEEEDAMSKHAFRDLKAYVCTLGGGECDEHFFGDLTTWFDHEMSTHRATYTCSLCDGARKTTRNFLRSHLALHGSFTDHQLEALEDATRDTVSNLLARDCPFCDEWAEKLGAKNMLSPSEVLVSLAKFKRHVAAHQEQLAIFALPQAAEEDASLEEDSRMGSTSESNMSLIVDEVDEDRPDDIQAQLSDSHQPESSQAAIERFEQMYRDTDSIISRATTWGTRRRSLPGAGFLDIFSRRHNTSSDDPQESSRGKAPLAMEKEVLQSEVKDHLKADKEEEAAHFRPLETESSILNWKAMDPDTPLSRRSVRGSTASFKRTMSNFFRRSHSQAPKDVGIIDSSSSASAGVSDPPLARSKSQEMDH
ncbi:hypothetical protein ACHAPT_011902 [Fusarium lateritium]